MLSRVIKIITEKLFDERYYNKNPFSREDLIDANKNHFWALIEGDLYDQEMFQSLFPIIADPRARWQNGGDGINEIYCPVLSFGLRVRKDADGGKPTLEKYKVLEKEYLDHLTTQIKILTLLALNGVTFYDLLETLMIFGEFKLFQQNYIIWGENFEDCTEFLQEITLREMFLKLNKIKKLEVVFDLRPF